MLSICGGRIEALGLEVKLEIDGSALVRGVETGELVNFRARLADTQKYG